MDKKYLKYKEKKNKLIQFGNGCNTDFFIHKIQHYGLNDGKIYDDLSLNEITDRKKIYIPIITFAYCCQKNIEITHNLFTESYILFSLVELYGKDKSLLSLLVRDIFDTANNTMFNKTNIFDTYYSNIDLNKSDIASIQIPKDIQIQFIKHCILSQDSKNRIFSAFSQQCQNVFEYLEFLISNIKYKNTVSKHDITHNLGSVINNNRGVETIMVPGINDFLFVYFPGHGEHHDGLKKLMKIHNDNNHAMIIVDWNNMWYRGKYQRIADIIREYIRTNNIKKTILFGQSMGGYMSIRMSCYLDYVISISMSPQTFNRKGNTLMSSKGNIMIMPTYTEDLYNEITKSNNNSIRYILVGMSECNSSNLHWGDLFFAGNLIKTKNTYILIVNQNIHALYSKIKAESFRDILTSNFTNFFTNPKDGLQILDNIEYFPS
jgi:hypothetical protein